MTPKADRRWFRSSMLILAVALLTVGSMAGCSDDDDDESASESRGRTESTDRGGAAGVGRAPGEGAPDGGAAPGGGAPGAGPAEGGGPAPDGAPPPDGGPAPLPTEGGGETDTGVYCAYVDALSGLLPPEPIEALTKLAQVYNPPPPAEQASSINASPEPIAGDLDIVLGALTTAAEFGDLSSIEAPRTLEAHQRINAFNQETCG